MTLYNILYKNTFDRSPRSYQMDRPNNNVMTLNVYNIFPANSKANFFKFDIYKGSSIFTVIQHGRSDALPKVGP